MLAGDDERTFPFGWARQRAHLAFEFQLLEREPRVACGIGKYGAAVLDGEPVDRNAVHVEAEL